MRNARRFKSGPLIGFTILSLLGFIFFTSSLALVWVYSESVDEFLIVKYKKRGLCDMIVFIILSTITAVGFLISFVQLAISKPRSKKVLIPIIVFTSVAFAILIALDFYLEVQLTHLPPKEVFTKTEPNGKKGKSRLKMGYLVIYVCMCIVAGFVYLAFKDLEEHLENQKKEKEKHEIVISHIF